MHHSLWLDQSKLKRFPTLKNDLETDVLVIGGGITGITTALLLVEEGYNVSVVDKNKLLYGTTGHTTAKVTIQHGLIYHNLIKKLGIDKSQLYVDSNQKALELIKYNIKSLDIFCDFEDVPSYVYTQREDKIKLIEKEFEAVQRLKIDSFITDELTLPFEIKGAIGFKNQGHFNITKYLQDLVEAFTQNDDSYIFEQSKVIKVKEDNNMCHTYLDSGIKIKSRHVVLASHYPCNDTYNLYFTKLEPTTSYVIAAKYHAKFDNADYINIEKPIRSIRTQQVDNDNLILIGGESHQTGNLENKRSHFDNLETFGKEYFNIEEPLYKWSNQDYKTFDNLPYIGRLNKKSPHIIVATGFKKWGMTTSHVAAMLARDLITNKKTDYEDLYDPRRFSDKLNCQYFRYNLKSAKNFIKDRLKKTPKDFNVEVGKGKIVSYKGKKYGVYKNENEELFIVDATCPHLKCILTFNNDQKTYDCPCHGSRFTFKGKYIDGPSIKDLKRINFKDIK
ncbi:FAD-dependent oxidoreductase [Mycoplasmatota bacterium]|nr:FAD-dependent oxidoreductase [Mycoplasmatota bacterium]